MVLDRVQFDKNIVSHRCLQIAGVGEFMAKKRTRKVGGRRQRDSLQERTSHAVYSKIENDTLLPETSDTIKPRKPKGKRYGSRKPDDPKR